MTIESLGLTVGQAVVAGAIGIMLAVLTDRYRRRLVTMTAMETANPSEAVTVAIKYPAGDTWGRTYSRTSYFCPFCGKAEVYEHDTMTDGNHAVCIACGEDFYWSGGVGKDGHATRQIVEQIKAAGGQ